MRWWALVVGFAAAGEESKEWREIVRSAARGSLGVGCSNNGAPTAREAMAMEALVLKAATALGSGTAASPRYWAGGRGLNALEVVGLGIDETEEDILVSSRATFAEAVARVADAVDRLVGSGRIVVTGATPAEGAACVRRLLAQFKFEEEEEEEERCGGRRLSDESPPPPPPPRARQLKQVGTTFYDDDSTDWCYRSPAVSCSAGTYSSDGTITTGSATTCSNGYCTECGCSTCPAGKYSSSGATECTSCSQGKYAASNGASECEECPEGYYASSTESTGCTASAAGHYATDSYDDSDGTGVESGAIYSVSCPSGKYSTTGTAWECDTCEAGAYTNTTTAATSCTECDAGYYAVEGSTSCTACPRGTYGVGGSTSSSCDGYCAAGRYGAASALTTSDCSGKCLEGYYGGEGETSEYCSGACLAGYRCAEGTAYDASEDTRVACGSGYTYPASVYCAEGTGSTPTSVSSGFYSTPTAVNASYRYGESQCEAGYYCSEGTRSCCPEGYYGEDTGETSSTCTAVCPSGYICEACCSSPVQCTDQVDATVVDPAAYFCPEGSASYKKAPEGYFTTPYSGSKYTRTGYQACQDDDYCAGDGSFEDLVTFSSCPSSLSLPEKSGAYYDFDDSILAVSSRSDNTQSITYSRVVRSSSSDFTDFLLRYYTFDDGDSSDSSGWSSEEEEEDTDGECVYASESTAIVVDSVYGDTCLYGYGCLYAAGDGSITYEAFLISSWLSNSFEEAADGTGATLAFWMMPYDWSADSNSGVVGIARVTFEAQNTEYSALLYMYDTVLYLDMGSATAWTGQDDSAVAYTICYIEEPEDVSDGSWSHFALSLTPSRAAIVLDGVTIASSNDLQDYFSDLSKISYLNVTEIALAPNIPDVDDSTSSTTVWYGAGGAKYYDDVMVFGAELYGSEITIAAAEDAVATAIDATCDYNSTLRVNESSGELYASTSVDYDKCSQFYATLLAKLPSDSSSSSSVDSIEFCNAPYASEILTLSLEYGGNDECTPGTEWTSGDGFVQVVCGNKTYTTKDSEYSTCGTHDWKCIGEDYAIVTYKLDTGKDFELYAKCTDGSGDACTVASCDDASSNACEAETELYHAFSRTWDTRSGTFEFNVTDDSVNNSKSCTMMSDDANYVSVFGTSTIYDNSETTITVLQRQSNIYRNMAIWGRVQSWPTENIEKTKYLNGYLCNLWTDQTEYIASLIIKYYPEGDGSGTTLAETDDAFEYKPQKWYSMKFTLDGSSLLCQIWQEDDTSGDPYVTLSATDSNFDTGMVGVQTYRDDYGNHYWNKITVNGTQVESDDETPAPTASYTPAPTYFKTDYDIYYPTAYAYCTVLVDVADENDAPTCDPSNVTFSVDEYSDLYTLIGTALDAYCTDSDSNMQSLLFSMNSTCSSTDAESSVGIETCGGQLYVLDDELDASDDDNPFTLCIDVCDDGGLCDSIAVTVVVDNVNDSPVIHESCPVVVYLPENSEIGTLTDQSSLNATDPDAGDTLTWSISTDPWSYILAINATSGELYANSSVLDYESQVTYAGFGLTVTDSGGLADTCSVTLKLLDENDAPEFSTTSSSYAVDEDASPGDDVGAVTATDEDGDTLVYNLSYAFVADSSSSSSSSSYLWLFAVTKKRGELSISSTASSRRVRNALDYESHPSREFTVGVSAFDGTASTVGNWTVTIADANDAPVANTSIFYVDENISPTYVVGNVSVYDQDVADGSQSLSYYIIADDPDVSGSVAFVSDSLPTLDGRFAFNYESKTTYTLTYKVTDSGVPAASDTAEIIVMVQDVNEAPSLDAYETDLVLYENSGVGGIVMTSSYVDFLLSDYASDPDDANTTYGTLAYSVVENDYFDVDGAYVVALQDFDYETDDDSYEVTVIVADGGGLSANLTYTISILDVNEKPSATSQLMWLPTNTDVGGSLGTLSGTDPESDTLTFNETISTEYANLTVAGGFVPEEILSFTTYSSGAVSVVLAQDITALDENFNFTYLVSARETSTPEKYYSANTATLKIAVVYEAYNQAPYFEGSKNFSVGENSADGTWIGTIRGLDPNDDQSVSFAVVSTAPTAAADAISLDVNSGNLSVAESSYFDYEAFASHKFYVVASITDSYTYPSSADATFAITLIDEPEAPVLDTINSDNFYVDEDAGFGHKIGTNITASDDDFYDLGYLTYSLSTTTSKNERRRRLDESSSPFSLVTYTDDADGQIAARLELASSLDYETESSYDISITVTDSTGLNDTTDLTVTVKDVDEAPIFDYSSYGFAIAEDAASTTVVGTVSATDEDGDLLKYELVNASGYPFAIAAAGNIYITETLDYETTSSYFFGVKVYESSTTEGYSDYANVTITVTDVNDLAVTAITPSTLGTLGGETVTLVGTNFGPTDRTWIYVNVSANYYDATTGTRFYARNCSVTVVNTEIQCLSDEGVGSDHTWNVTLRGVDEDDGALEWIWSTLASATTSYATPSIDEIVSIASASGDTLTALPTAGGATVTLNGTGFPPYCTIYCEHQACGGECVGADETCDLMPFEGTNGSYACSADLEDAIDVLYGLSDFSDDDDSAADFECDSVAVVGPYTSDTAALASYSSTVIECTTGDGYGGPLYWEAEVGLDADADSSLTSGIYESDVSHQAPSITSISYSGGAPATNLSTAGGETLYLNGTNFGPVTASDFSATYGPVTGSGTKYAASSCEVTVAHTRAVCDSAAGVGADLVWVATRSDIESSVSSAYASYAAPEIATTGDIVGGVGASGGTTAGDEYFYIQGTNFGPTTEVLSPSVAYGPSGTEYVASDCAVVVSHTKIGCYTVAGTGKNLAARVTVGSQDSDISYDTNISYGAPTVSYYVGSWDSNDDRSGQLAAGGEWVLIYGTNFGTVSADAIDAVYYGPEEDPDRYVACDVSLDYGGVTTRRLLREGRTPHRRTTTVRGPWHSEPVVSLASGRAWPHLQKGIKTSAKQRHSPTSQRAKMIIKQATREETRSTASRSFRRRRRRPTTKSVASPKRSRGRDLLMVETDAPTVLPSPTPTPLPSEPAPSYTESPTYSTAPTETTAPTASCECYVTVSHYAINCTTVPATGTDHLWTVVIDGQASDVASTDTEEPSITGLAGAGRSDAAYAGDEVVIIYGENFGEDSSTLDEVTYGPSGTEWTARNCSVVRPDSEIACRTAPGLGTSMTWIVTVDGQSSDESDETSSYVVPVLSSISPSTATSSGGDTLVISGTNLGYLASDITLSVYWDDDLEAIDGDARYSEFTSDYVYECSSSSSSTGDDSSSSSSECFDFTLPEMDDTDQSRTLYVKLKSSDETSISESSNSVDFTYSDPYISAVSNVDGDASGTTDLVITGTSFALSGTLYVDSVAQSVSTWDHERITLTYTGDSGNVTVAVGSATSNTVRFEDSSPLLMYGYEDYSCDSDGYRTDALDIPGSGLTENCTLAGYYVSSDVDDLAVYVGDFEATVISGGTDVTSDFPDATRTVRSVTFEIPQGYGTDNMVVVYSNGRSSYSGNLSQVHYVDYNAPVVQQIVPPRVNTTGGTVYLYGYNFGRVADVVSLASSSSDVTYSVYSVIHTNLTIKVAAGVGTAESMTIRVDDQSTTLYRDDEVEPVDFLPPVITRWNPETVQHTAGGDLTVYGYNFGTSPTVSWTPVGTWLVLDDDDDAGDHTELSLSVGRGQGTHLFTVAAGDQNATALISYKSPYLISLTPDEAKTKGGTALTLNGTNLGTGSNYELSMTSYSGEYSFTSLNVTSYDDASITLRSPEGQADGDLKTSLTLCADIDLAWTCANSEGVANFSFEPPRFYYFSGGANDEDVLFSTCYGDDDDDDDDDFGSDDCTSSVTATCDRWTSDACGLSTEGGDDGDYAVTIVGENFGTSLEATVNWDGSALDDSYVLSVDHEAIEFMPPQSSGTDIPVRVTIGSRESNVGYFSYDPPWVTRTSPTDFDADGDSIYLYGRNFGQTKSDAGSPIRVWIGDAKCEAIASSIWQQDDDDEVYLWCETEDSVRVGYKSLKVEVAYQNNSWDADDEKIYAECGSGKYGQEAFQVYSTEYGYCYSENNLDWDCSAYAAKCMNHWNSNISTEYDESLAYDVYYEKGGWLTADEEAIDCYTENPCKDSYLWGADANVNCSVLTRFDEFCVDCPAGSTCDDFNSLYPVEPVATSGHYRLQLDGLSGSNCATNREHRTVCWEFVSCSPTDACLGNNTCDEGYTKSKCGKCCDNSNIDTPDCEDEKDDDQYYYRTDGKCEKCPENIALTACLIIAAVVAGGYTAYVLKKKRVDIGIFSIGIDFMQVLSIFAATNLAWPPAVKVLYNSLSLFSLDFLNVFPPACSVDVGYETEWWIVELAPLFVGACIAAVYFVGLLFIKLGNSRRQKREERKKLRRLRSTMIGVALYLFYFLYVLVAQNTLDVFNCDKIDDDDGDVRSSHKYMSSEPTEQCWKKGEMQQRLVPWASIFFVLYVIGYPVVLASVLLPEAVRALMFDDQLLRAQGKGWDDDGITDYLMQLREVRVRYALLYYRFKPLYNYWFIPVVMRKMFLSIFSLIFRSSASFQLAALLLVMFIAYVAHCRCLPYMSPHDREEVLSKNVARCALLYEEEQKCEKARDLVLHGRHKKVLVFQMGTGDQLLSRKHIAEAVTQEFIDYNNVEAFLLAACILICLFGIMLDSEYLDDGNHRDEKHVVVNLTVAVIVVSLVYYFLVVWHEIIGAIFPSLRFTCFGLISSGTVTEEEDDKSEIDEDVELADGNPQFAQGAAKDDEEEQENIMTIQEQLEAKRLIERLTAENRSLKHDLQVAQMARDKTRAPFKKKPKKRGSGTVELGEVFGNDQQDGAAVEMPEMHNPMRAKPEVDLGDVFAADVSSDAVAENPMRQRPPSKNQVDLSVDHADEDKDDDEEVTFHNPMRK
ncbi:hypothetical protein CTAYLR_009739 [Chrysophaeum taylorii]|uniref:Cadherin domain-containing protein n=1 Tax=Chrysophaeum taylorii TaxID=2483200 RepID=A0AAD7UIZ3_9STRA|nr:hypothetical protein CTAYLR_009739 [Chrysophaeum taylorii]